MRGEQLELERLAREIRRRARLGDDEVALATTIAGRVLGPNAIAIDPCIRGAAYLITNGEGHQIVLNPAAHDIRFHVAHEIGEWALRFLAKFDGDEGARERAANYLAAAILAPPSALLRAYAATGERIRALASAFGLSQTSIVLRLAEVRGDERAVVTRTGYVFLRSQGAFPWATVPLLDVARGQARWAGLAKARLRGGIDEGRVALRAR